MNIYLAPADEKYVQEKIKSGNYHSASEVINDALRLLNEQDQLREIRREEVHREVMKGVEQMRNGEYTTYNSIDELREHLIEKFKREGRKRLADRE